jgi:putative membrane protein
MHRVIAAGLAMLAPAAQAHHGAGDGSPGGLAIEAMLALFMLSAAFGYACGVARLWRRAGVGRGIRQGDAARFAFGWAALAVALWSPLDALAERSFAVHMVQHELLMVVAAPLLVASRAFEAWACALRGSVRGRAVRGLVAVAAGWRRLAAPRIAWWLHAAALWAWHVPTFFVAALHGVALHDLQHLSFFGSALLFWWAVLGRGLRGREGPALALLFTTMLHMNALGLLLTFAPAAWYAPAASTTPFGLTALEDQQLGGVVMWGLGGLVYVGVALAIVAAWLAPPRNAAVP